LDFFATVHNQLATSVHHGNGNGGLVDVHADILLFFSSGDAAGTEDRQGREGAETRRSPVLSYQGLRPTKPHENHSDSKAE
jgi:hypothetical protein